MHFFIHKNLNPFFNHIYVEYTLRISYVSFTEVLYIPITKNFEGKTTLILARDEFQLKNIRNWFP